MNGDSAFPYSCSKYSTDPGQHSGCGLYFSMWYSPWDSLESDLFHRHSESGKVSHAFKVNEHHDEGMLSHAEQMGCTFKIVCSVSHLESKRSFESGPSPCVAS